MGAFKIPAAAIFLLAAGAASAATLPDGEYDCAVPNGMGVMPLGRADIQGGTYRFRPQGKVSDGFRPYAMRADGAIRWSGPLGSMGRPPSVILESFQRAYGFSVKYRASPNGFAEVMSCKHMQH